MLPTVLKQAEEARTRYKVETSLSDAITVVQLFLTHELGLVLQDEATLDRIDDDVRELLRARGPVGTADMVTVLASLVTSLLNSAATPDGSPQALFDSLIHNQVETTRRLQAMDKGH
ncbi:hypothetical protein [Streptomyces sp. NPDC055056]